MLENASELCLFASEFKSYQVWISDTATFASNINDADRDWMRPVGPISYSLSQFTYT